MLTMVIFCCCCCPFATYSAARSVDPLLGFQMEPLLWGRTDSPAGIQKHIYIATIQFFLIFSSFFFPMRELWSAFMFLSYTDMYIVR